MSLREHKWDAALAEVATEVVDGAGPGLAIGAYRDGRLVGQTTAGLACVEFSVPVRADTRFDIASVSKQFCATAALLLCRDGKLALDDDIRIHLPELRLSRAVTVGQCLRHTGGIPDYLGLAELAGRPMTRITQDQALAFLAGLTELSFVPESEFSYSNSGYVLVASLVHRLSGRTLREFAAERIFGPLGMTDTLFRDDSREVLPRFAYGYAKAGDRMVRADSEECLVGDGALVTSIADLGPWFGFLADGRILGVDIRDGLLATVGPAGGTPRHYAHGLSHSRIGGHHVVGHSGGVSGYRSHLYLDLDAGVGIAVLTNNSALAPTELAEKALRSVVDLEPVVPPEFRDGSAVATTLTGHWINPANDMSVCLEADGEGLRIAEGPASGEFRLTADGSWHGQAHQAGVRIWVDGDTILLGMAVIADRAGRFRRCAGPDPVAALPVGVWRSPELGTLISIDSDGRAEIGLNLVDQVRPGPDRSFTAAGFVLRLDGDDLVVTTGSHRTRFHRQDADTRPLGVPVGLNIS